MVDLCHTTINHKVGTVNKATLVASQKENSLRLFNGFTKPASRKVNLSAVSFRGIIT
jgi:hypothetical protein